MRKLSYNQMALIGAALVSAFIPVQSRALQLQYAPATGGLKLGAGGDRIYKSGWIDLNKNGQKDIYEDPSQPVEKRVEDLLAKMNVQEKLSQLRPRALSDEFGYPLRGEECCPGTSDAEERNGFLRIAVEGSRLGIPLAFGFVAQGAATSGMCASKGLDDSVRLVLRAKFLMGLFDKPYRAAGASEKATPRFLPPGSCLI